MHSAAKSSLLPRSVQSGELFVRVMQKSRGKSPHPGLWEQSCEQEVWHLDMKLCIKQFAIYEHQVYPIPMKDSLHFLLKQTLLAWLAHSRSFRIHYLSDLSDLSAQPHSAHGHGTSLISTCWRCRNGMEWRERNEAWSIDRTS